MNILKKIFGGEEPKNTTQTTEQTTSISENPTSPDASNEDVLAKHEENNMAESLVSDTTVAQQEKTVPASASVEMEKTETVEAKTTERSASSNAEPTPSAAENENRAEEPDMKTMLKKSFVNWESNYRHQEISLTEDIKLSRSSFESYTTVRQLLETFYPSLKDVFTGRNFMSKVTDDNLSTGSAQSVGDILDVSPFAFIFKQEKENQLSVIDESFAMHLEYKGADSKFYYLHMFVKVLGQAEHCAYIRVTTMKPAEVPDDMMTCRTVSAPECRSAIMVYDVLDATEDLKFFDETLASAQKKMEAKEELDEFEVEAINGIYGLHLPPYNYGFANWLFEKERYYDAYVVYERVYNALKPNFHTLDKASREVFFNTCFHMGACLQQWGVLDKACYYFELASSSGDNTHIAAYVNILAILSHNRVFYFLNQVRSQAEKNEAAKNEAHRLESLMAEVEKHYTYPESYNSGVLTLGYVLNHMFDIDSRCVMGATINHTVNADITPEVVGNADAWNLNLYDLKDTVVYVRYSRAQWQIKGEHDKSILCSDNAILLSIQSVVTDDGKSGVRVNVMIPNFSRNDEKRDFVRCNLPIMGSFAIGAERPDMVYAKEQLKEIYQHSIELLNERRIFEAMQGFEYIHRALKIEYTKASATDEIEEMFFEATYQLGFCMVELGIYEKATYYLDWAQEGQKAEYAQEYVNCMCNNNDVRALGLIEANLKSLVKPEEPEYQQAFEFHKSFLLRRKSYMLINLHMFDEAETLLKELLNDPASKEFAEHELASLQQMRAQN